MDESCFVQCVYFTEHGLLSLLQTKCWGVAVTGIADSFEKDAAELGRESFWHCGVSGMSQCNV